LRRRLGDRARGAFDIEKETRFLEALGQRAAIRWVEGETAASVIITAVEDFAYDLLVAGTPHRHMDDKPFAGDVAPELLRNAPCDLLLVPRPLEDPAPPQHIVFAFEPEQKEDRWPRSVSGVEAKRVPRAFNLSKKNAVNPIQFVDSTTPI
jgi:hypothetical protein